MYVYVLYSIFQCEFSYNCYYVIQRLYFYIWSSPSIIFHFASDGNGYYIIWRLYSCHIIESCENIVSRISVIVVLALSQQKIACISSDLHSPTCSNRLLTDQS